MNEPAISLNKHTRQETVNVYKNTESYRETIEAIVWYLFNNVQIQILHLLLKTFWNAYFKYLVHMQEWTNALKESKQWK